MSASSIERRPNTSRQNANVAPSPSYASSAAASPVGGSPSRRSVARPVTSVPWAASKIVRSGAVGASAARASAPSRGPPAAALTARAWRIVASVDSVRSAASRWRSLPLRTMLSRTYGGSTARPIPQMKSARELAQRRLRRVGHLLEHRPVDVAEVVAGPVVAGILGRLLAGEQAAGGHVDGLEGRMVGAAPEVRSTGAVEVPAQDAGHRAVAVDQPCRVRGGDHVEVDVGADAAPLGARQPVRVAPGADEADLLGGPEPEPYPRAARLMPGQPPGDGQQPRHPAAVVVDPRPRRDGVQVRAGHDHAPGRGAGQLADHVLRARAAGRRPHA